MEKICVECGKQFNVAPAHQNRKRCSLVCRKNMVKKPREQIVQEHNQKPETRLRKRLWHEQKNFSHTNLITQTSVCELCGFNSDLLVHHKDGQNGRFGQRLNNSKSNLQILCRSCHGKIHRFDKAVGKVVVQYVK